MDQLDFYDLYSTYGLPLEIILAGCKDKDVTPLWNSFIRKAHKDGWNLRSHFRQWFNAVNDVYGPAYAIGWAERTKELVEELYGIQTN